MVDFGRSLAWSAAFIALAGATACGGGKATDVVASGDASDAKCVTIAEGLYVFENGKFTATAVPQPEVVERVTRESTGWVGDIENAFTEAGFPWLALVTRQNVAVLTGLAPDAEAKRVALERGTAAVQADPIGSGEITLIVDGIGVESGERGPGESLAVLAQGGISPEACQQALNGTMEGQKIQFPTNRGEISPVSTGLLDAIAGISMLCDEYPIEVGSHTDSRGSDEYNQVLSQKRADAVRQYLLEKGVAIEQVTAVGYGEALPLDKAETYEAWGRNARTEFKISRPR